jgi:hypothetical protein
MYLYSMHLYSMHLYSMHLYSMQYAMDRKIAAAAPRPA